MSTVPDDPKILEETLVSALGITPEQPAERQTAVYQRALHLCWERMENVVGRLGAKAIAEHAVKLASRRQPQIASMSVTESGLDFSPLMAEASRNGYEGVGNGLRELCVAVFRTLVELTGDVLAAPLLEEFKRQAAGDREV